MTKIKTFLSLVLTFFITLTGASFAHAHAGHDHLTFIDLYIKDTSIIVDVKMEADVIQETFNTNMSDSSPETLNLIATYVAERTQILSGETELPITIVDTRIDEEEPVLKNVVRLEAQHTEPISDTVSFAFNFFITEDIDHTLYVFLFEDSKYGVEEDLEMFSLTDLYYGSNGLTIMRGEEISVEFFNNDTLPGVWDPAGEPSTLITPNPILVEEGTGETEETITVPVRFTEGKSFTEALTLGFQHIIDGLDHLLFLAMILIPAPFIVQKVGKKLQWGGLRTLKDTLIRMVIIVTVFTVGHSITLALTTITRFDYPELPIELLVAGSIGLAAVHAWKPLIAKGEILIAGIFGLFHGVAFAGALQSINMQGFDLFRTLAGFNIGVELAHLAVLAVILPLIWFASKWEKYGTVLRPVLAIIGIAASLTFGVSLILEEIG